jgi:hypothetical protein
LDDDVQQLDDSPARGIETYGESYRKKLLNTRKIENKDILYVQCPLHPWQLMTPIKVRSHRYGEHVVFQCHAVDERNLMCLIIADFFRPLESASYLKPGDVLKHETWRTVLEKVQQINREQSVNRPFEAKSPTLSFIPPNPWEKKGTLVYVVWDTFWNAMYERNECTVDELFEAWHSKRGEYQKNKLYDMTLGTAPLTSWMRKRTGFVIKLFGDRWKIVGRSEGVTDRFPWSSDEYRKQFHSSGELTHMLSEEQDDEQEEDGISEEDL